jgi:hypothetical protein
MRAAILCALLIASNATYVSISAAKLQALKPAPLKDDAYIAGQILEGLAMGIIDEAVPLQQCISEPTTVYNDFVNAYNDLVNYKQGYQYVFNGIQQIAQGIQDAQSAISDCEGVAGLLSDLEDIVEAFADPTALFWHSADNIIFHSGQIAGDVGSAVTAWQNQEWYNFGNSIGSIIYIVLNESAPRGPITNSQLFLIAFFDAAFEMELPIAECEANTKNSAAILMEAYAVLTDEKDVGSIIACAKIIAKNYKVFLDDYETCDDTIAALTTGA